VLVAAAAGHACQPHPAAVPISSLLYCGYIVSRGNICYPCLSLLLQVMPASHIPLLYLTNSLLQTFLTAPLSKLSGSSIQVRVWG
jgi:hypothetical protein